MPKLLRNVLALFAGIVLGGVVNMAIVTLGPALIAPPPGVNVGDPESLRKAMHLFEPRHFVMPFLAHAVGTLCGALVTCLAAVTRKAQLAYGVGAFFLLGGLAASFMMPAPVWFIALDLVVAYLPMAWLAIQVAMRMRLVGPDARKGAAG